MTKQEEFELNIEAETSYQQMADWAKNELHRAQSSGTTRHRTEAAAHGRSVLLKAGMDPAEMDRLIGGRPSLDPEAKPG